MWLCNDAHSYWTAQCKLANYTAACVNTGVIMFLKTRWTESLLQQWWAARSISRDWLTGYERHRREQHQRGRRVDRKVSSATDWPWEQDVLTDLLNSNGVDRGTKKVSRHVKMLRFVRPVIAGDAPVTDIIHEAARNSDVSRGGLFQGSVFVDRVLRMGDATPAQVFAPAIAWRLRQPVTASVLLRAADLA